MLAVGVAIEQAPYVLRDNPQWLGPVKHSMVHNPALGWLASVQLTLTVLYAVMARKRLISKVMATLPAIITLVALLWLWMQEPPEFFG